MEIVLICAYIVVQILLIIGFVIKKISRKKPFAHTNSISRDWYGTCEKCGKTDGLHRFEGAKYCAICYAKLKAEKKFGVNQEKYED